MLSGTHYRENVVKDHGPTWVGEGDHDNGMIGHYISLEPGQSCRRISACWNKISGCFACPTRLSTEKNMKNLLSRLCNPGLSTKKSSRKWVLRTTINDIPRKAWPLYHWNGWKDGSRKRWSTCRCPLLISQERYIYIFWFSERISQSHFITIYITKESIQRQ